MKSLIQNNFNIPYVLIFFFNMVYDKNKYKVVQIWPGLICV